MGGDGAQGILLPMVDPSLGNEKGVNSADTSRSAEQKEFSYAIKVPAALSINTAGILF
jgi:hypothetical protein